jgi:ATP-dependent RNA helicase RhlE
LTFKELGLDPRILQSLSAKGYETPTPIQTKAIRPVLQGRDVVGLAQTGTGKTAAFTLPLLHRMAHDGHMDRKGTVRVLVLSPTRELAAQIRASVVDYGRRLPFKSVCITGGVPVRRQIRSLAAGVDILVATPGRLIDLVNQKAVHLNHVEALVLDEADHMLDIGFLPDIRRIIAMVPKKRQTLLFSATMPKKIRQLTEQYQDKPVEISVAPVAKTADKIDQAVMHVPRTHKMAAVTAIVGANRGKRIIMFTRTKRGADKVVRKLGNEGFGAAAIHGNKSQGQRDRALAGFKDGSCPVLVATDIAARGIDVPDVSMVINYELPNVPEVYVHRIGRTARAGAEGQAVSLCDAEEQPYLKDIEKLIKREIPVIAPPFEITPLDLEAAAASLVKHKQQQEKQKAARRRKPRHAGGQKSGGQKAAGKRPGNRTGGNKPAGNHADDGKKKTGQQQQTKAGGKPGGNTGGNRKRRPNRQRRRKPSQGNGAPRR